MLKKYGFTISSFRQTVSYAQPEAEGIVIMTTPSAKLAEMAPATVTRYENGGGIQTLTCAPWRPQS